MHGCMREHTYAGVNFGNMAKHLVGCYMKHCIWEDGDDMEDLEKFDLNKINPKHVEGRPDFFPVKHTLQNYLCLRASS